MKRLGKKLRLGKETLTSLDGLHLVHGGLTRGCEEATATYVTCPCTLQCSNTQTPSCVPSGCTHEN